MTLTPRSDFDPFNYTIAHNSLNIILSTPHRSDDATTLKALNDPRVGSNLSSVPFPYTESDRDFWYHTTKDASDLSRREWDVLQQDRASTGTAKKWMGSDQWVSVIRVGAPGSKPLEEGLIYPFIGEITFRRSGFPQIEDVKLQRQATDANAELPAGDPNILWDVGYYLIAEYHGKGIMPAVLSSLIKEVLVPYMNVHRLIGVYFEQNLASKRVFEKCGFRFVKLVPKAVSLPEVKFIASGFKEREIGIGVMQWEKALPT
ncbi:hypothetical protein LTR84_001678 [Exophiala bonariae]|uniref:N-acetyltransferase domain-containing protein n=1 Tax=Exophiala bonariae TaxID=1690606 RepID=A0AAV9NBD2_9EURO|nr:hypothetical protein LTR84_001678 [Exophiala bonariae]